MNQSRNISDLRETIFDVIQDVRAGKISVDQAQAINDLSKTIVDSAKVEVDYLRVNNGGESTFIEAVGNAALPPGVTRHQIK